MRKELLNPLDLFVQGTTHVKISIGVPYGVDHDLCSSFSGLWEGVNCVFGLKMFTAWCTLAVGTLVLSFARCLRSIVSPPVGVVPDAQEVAIQTSSILDALNVKGLH